MFMRGTVVVCLSLAARLLAADTENWPQWRGPNLDGTSAATGLPTKWSTTENVRWRTDLPSWSGATPIIWGDRIFVMSPSKLKGNDKAPTVDGKIMAGPRMPEGRELFILCLSKQDGSILWQKELGSGNVHYGKQNMTSPSPVTDGKHVWVLLGTGMFFCLDMDGREIWKFDIQKDSGKFGLNWGFASSPLLWDNMLIIPVLHGWDTDDPSYLLAYDPRTGKLIWKVERPTDAVKEGPDSYITPMPMRYGDGHVEILISGGDCVTGHDPKTGRELWRCWGLNPKKDPYYRTVSSPMHVGDVVIASTKRNPIIGVRGGGKGDVTETHLLWSNSVAPDVPTPVTDGKHLYVVHDDGTMSCLNPQTGERYYERQRLPRGTYSASPLLADGRIYVTSENATTAVVALGPEFKILHTNELKNELKEEYTLSSIAVSGKQLFIRTASALYCIGR